MKKNILLEKSYLFSLRVTRLCRYLNDKKGEFVLSKQILFSGTNVGAFVEESQQADDRTEFVRLLSMANKNAFKSNFWLRLLKDSDMINDQMFASLVEDCVEIQKLLVSTLKTTRRSLAE